MISYLALPEDTVEANCNFACNYKQTEHGKVNCYYKQDKAGSQKGVDEHNILEVDEDDCWNDDRECE